MKKTKNVKRCLKRCQIYFLKFQKINLTPFYVLLLIVPIQAGCAYLGFSISRSISGTIVDAQTNAPLSGVVVTASWSVTGWHSEDVFKVAEAVTDTHGAYTLPGWGPSLRPGKLGYDQPVVRFFKPGYVPLVIFNRRPYHPGLEGDRKHMIKKTEWLPNGQKITRLYEPEVHQVRFGKKKHTFMLEPFVGTDEAYRKLVRDEYVGSLGWIPSGRRCEWKQLPITFTTLHKLSLKLGLPKNRGIFYVSYLGGQDHCGNAEEYFKEYLE